MSDLKGYAAELARSSIHVQANLLISRYKGFVERDDLIQEMFVWVIAHKARVIEWLEAEDKADRLEGERALRTSLRRHGERYARQQKAASSGYDTTDEYFYEVSLVEELLPEAFGRRDGWRPTANDADTGRLSKTPLLAEGNDHWAKVSDVADALSKLSLYYFTILRYHHVMGTSIRALAESWGKSKSQMQRDLNAALWKVVRELGGSSPWEGDKSRRFRRPVMSNAQAVAALDDV